MYKLHIYYTQLIALWFFWIWKGRNYNFRLQKIGFISNTLQL